MMERMEPELYAILGYKHCIMAPMVVDVLFLNDCLPRLALRERFHCIGSLICRWGDFYLHHYHMGS